MPSTIEETPWGGTRSTGWKEVTMRIHKTGEELKLPLMTTTKVRDVKILLGEMVGIDPVHIDLLAKVGISMKRLRPTDEISSEVLVKNIQSFTKPKQQYPHPYVIIGAGHFGLRQAMHYQRHSVDYVLVDRKHRIGGNAWVDLANDTSCTQSEGCHYQLSYDPLEGTKALKQDYGCWPSRERILTHFEDVCDEYGVTPHIKLNVDVSDMIVNSQDDWVKTSYSLLWDSTKDNSTSGEIVASNLCVYPGAMVDPRQAEWPGEGDFDGQIEYAHGNLFDYFQVRDKNVIIIGMGAFANENIRTSIEFGAKKIYMVVRHKNVFLPRCVCWFVNQSINAPPGTMVFKMMEPIYNLIGWDIYSMPTVICNKDRTSVLLRQTARWGTGDIFFVAMYFGKVELITAEVKRFKHHGAVLTDGTVIKDVEHVMKCLGFVGDFSVDKLMKTTQHVAIWPDGDWRRCVYAEFLAIDAGRFGGTAFGPGGASIVFYTLWYHQHPSDTMRLLGANVLAKNTVNMTLMKPAYDFPPRLGSMNMLQLSGFVPEIVAWEANSNTPFKKASVWHLQYPEKHVAECKEDWEKYCELMTEQGATKPWPEYPYTAQDLHDYAKLDADLNPAAAGLAPASEEDLDLPGGFEVVGKQRPIHYGSAESFLPAREVLVARSQSPSPKPTRSQVDRWYRDAVKTVSTLAQAR